MNGKMDVEMVPLIGVESKSSEILEVLEHHFDQEFGSFYILELKTLLKKYDTVSERLGANMKMKMQYSMKEQIMVEHIVSLNYLCVFIESVEMSNFWLDVSNYTEHDLRNMAKIFGIHPLILDVIVQRDNSERCDIWEEFAFLSTQFLAKDGTLRTIYIIVGQNYCLTFHEADSDVIPIIESVHQRLSKINLKSFNPTLVLYAILDRIVDEFVPNVEFLGEESINIEERVNKPKEYSDPSEFQKHDMQKELSSIRKRVVLFHRCLQPKLEVLKKVTSAHQRLRKNTISYDVNIYLIDVTGNIELMIQQLNEQVEIINRSEANYISHVNLDLTRASDRSNETMQKFTGCSCVFLPLTLIATIFGMNVQVPGNLDSPGSSNVWFWLISGFMLTLALSVVFLGRKMKWFDLFK